MSRKLLLVGACAAAAVSCSKKSSDDTSSSTASSVADLKLSSALSIDIPDDLETAAGGSSSSLALADGKKSSEACRVMENTNRVFEDLKEISSMFCHLEIESDKMKFGTKYNVTIKGDAGLIDQSMNIWVDNSDASKLKVYNCQAGKLTQQFTIEGFGGEGLVKGMLYSTHEETMGSQTSSGGMAMEFDFTTSGVKLVKAFSKHTNVGGDYEGSFRTASDISIVDGGLSSIKMSSAGTLGTDKMNDQGAVLFNGTMGQALFTGSGTYGSQEYNFTSRSTFDSTGVAVSKSTATEDVVVSKDSLPAKLAADFTPDAPAGWDCTGATETIEVDMTEASKKAQHDACNTDHNKSFSQCWGDDFEYGEQE